MMRLPLLALALTTTLLFSPSLFAQQASVLFTEPKNPWRPPVSMQKDFDWIKLTSDEWLKGELIALYQDSLEFDSDEIGLLSFDWDDVAEVLSYKEKSLRLQDGRIVTGRLHINGGIVKLNNNGETSQIKRDMIVSIAASGDQEWSYWSGKISFGANVREGNTDQTDITFDLSAKRRTAQSRWINSYLANSTKIDGIETEDNQRFNSSFDWFLTNRLFWRAITYEYFSDRFQNTDSRVTVSTELGYQLFDTKDFFWEVTGGVGYQTTKFNSVEVGDEDEESTTIGTFGTDIEWDITGDIEYIFHYDVQLVSEAAGDRIHHMKTGFDIEIIKDFDLEISYYWDRVDKPTLDAEGNLPEEDDKRLVIGLSYEF
jgi:putative salt-induced outer membrane protein YdiY